MLIYKNYINKYFTNQNYVNLIIAIIFIVFVTPYSLRVGSQGVSANYLFVLSPLFFYIYFHEFNWPNFEVIAFIALLVCIFIVALMYQSEYIEYFIRRSISFLIFMSIFAFMFVKINPNMVLSFKFAIIIYSVYVSSYTLIEYISWGGEELGLSAKGLVGSQRIGFVYILAIWIIYFLKTRSIFFLLLKHLAASIIIIGLFLTFSRTSFFSLFATIFAYFGLIIYAIIEESGKRVKLLRDFLLSIAYVAVIIAILVNILPGVSNYYKITIYNYILPAPASVQTIELKGEISRVIAPEKTIDKPLFSPDLKKDEDEDSIVLSQREKDLKNSISAALFKDTGDSSSSIGYRIYMLEKIRNYVSNNLFTGSGYLGVWVMFDDSAGSAHGQCSDVFFI
jgi:hypothetical protein